MFRTPGPAIERTPRPATRRTQQTSGKQITPEIQGKLDLADFILQGGAGSPQVRFSSATPASGDTKAQLRFSAARRRRESANNSNAQESAEKTRGSYGQVMTNRHPLLETYTFFLSEVISNELYIILMVLAYNIDGISRLASNWIISFFYEFGFPPGGRTSQVKSSPEFLEGIYWEHGSQNPNKSANIIKKR